MEDLAILACRFVVENVSSSRDVPERALVQTSRRLEKDKNEVSIWALSGDGWKNELLAHVTHEDVMSFGIIPELAGRLPVLTYLEELSEEALVQVLTEPKNAIIKQYQELFSMDGVELVFTEDALAAAADRALEQQTGARCLRYVIEETLLDVMYDLPSAPEVVRCQVDGPAIQGDRSPTLITDTGKTFNLPLGPIQKSA